MTDDYTTFRELDAERCARGVRRAVKLFHETRSEVDADAIMRDGFRDSEALSHLAIPAGVWLSDSATATAATGGTGHRVAVDVPDDVASRFRVVNSPGEIMGRWHEFCMLAEIVNRFDRARVVHTPVEPRNPETAD